MLGCRRSVNRRPYNLLVGLCWRHECILLIRIGMLRIVTSRRMLVDAAHRLMARG